MKAIKSIFLATAMAFAMNSSAKIFEDNHFMCHFDLGASHWDDTGVAISEPCFGLGAGFQTGIYENSWISLAWDVVRFDWVAPFQSPKDWNELHVKTGLRAFSPSFASGKVRAYTNLGMGYSNILTDWGSGWEGNSSFGLDWGIGLQFKEKISIGYSLGYLTWDKSKNHFFSIGYTF